jgi:hypothetical protein
MIGRDNYRYFRVRGSHPLHVNIDSISVLLTDLLVTINDPTSFYIVHCPRS